MSERVDERIVLGDDDVVVIQQLSNSIKFKLREDPASRERIAAVYLDPDEADHIAGILRRAARDLRDSYDEE